MECLYAHTRSSCCSVFSSVRRSLSQDNGLKAVDPRGEMLASSWEPYCSEAANAQTDEELFAVLQKLIKADSIDLQTPAVVVYAHDTRPSSPRLVKAIEAGLAAMGAEARNGGLLTTPQLHYLVKAYNTQGTNDPYGEPTEEGYYKKLADAFQRAVVRTCIPKLPACECKS